jgi:hypothetical protein
MLMKINVRDNIESIPNKLKACSFMLDICSNLLLILLLLLKLSRPLIIASCKRVRRHIQYPNERITKTNSPLAVQSLY